MPGHALRDLQLASVLQVGGNSGGPEAVGADPGSQPRRLGPLLNHHVHIGLGQGSAAGQPAMAQGREERSLRLRAKPGDGDPLFEIMVEIVVTGKLGHLAALLVEPYPAAALLHVEILDSHPGGCSDAGEGVAHEPDEGPVPQSEQGSGVDRGQEVVHLLDREHRGLPWRTLCFGPRTA